MTADGMTVAVTGAFGYSGRRIAKRLLEGGNAVVNLTGSPNRPNPFGDRMRVLPLAFNDPKHLEDSLRGVGTLINTYWVRFNHRLFSHAEAVRNTLALFEAAKRAGVGRIVHVSITNPSEDSPLSYFRGKAQLERALGELGLPHSVLRPAVLFGGEDILINNIAWVLRHAPIFGTFGDATRYGLQPIHVDDFADLAAQEAGKSGSRVIDAIGPESFTYRGLVETIADIIGVKRPIAALPPGLSHAAGWIIGLFLRDVVITRDEIRGLMADLLRVDSPPAGQTRLTGWARENAGRLGRKYASEMARRRDRARAYTPA